MKPIKTIKALDWITDDIRRIMMILNADASGVSALFVGGCVRNALLGKTVHDVDVASSHTPDAVMDLIKNSDIKLIPTGIDHGTVTLVLNDAVIEVTMLRQDIETDGRHAVVSYTNDWAQDARRRDFTMNTLLMNVNGEVFDPLGSGVDDLEARRVVFVGEPAERITEDYLRILRFFRFHAFYGSGAPDGDGLAACARHADGIKALSKERVTKEFLTLISAPEPTATLGTMFENNIMKGVVHKRFDHNILSRACMLQTKFDCNDVIARLCILSALEQEHMAIISDYILLSNKQKKLFQTIVQAFELLEDFSVKQLKVSLYRYGIPASLHAVIIKAAQKDQDISGMINIIRVWQKPEFPINGNDIQKMGVTEGKLIGDLLRAAEVWWIEHDFEPDKSACLKMLESSF